MLSTNNPLPGPPTQTVSGVTNKSAIIDGPNINILKKQSTTLSNDNKYDLLGKDWMPNKYDPKSVSGTTKYVDPKTGIINDLTGSKQPTLSRIRTVKLSI